MICCLSSGDTYLFLWVIISASSSVSSLLCDSFVNCFFLKHLLFYKHFITNQITSCFSCFLNCSFLSIFIASALDFLALLRSFWLYLLLKLSANLFACLPKFLSFYIYSISWFIWISHFYKMEMCLDTYNRIAFKKIAFSK